MPTRKTDEPRTTTCFIEKSQHSFTHYEKGIYGSALQHSNREHNAAEGKVLHELLQLDESYRNYFKDWLKEFDVQRMAADKLMEVTEDYCLQVDTNCKSPLVRSIETEDEIIKKYQLHFQIILGSNNTLRRGLSTIRTSLLSFRRECAKLDMNEETPFIVGDSFHKPIQFFIDLAEEVFDYFHSCYLQMDCSSRLLDPSDLGSLQNYQKRLARCEEFEDYLMQNLSYCYCLLPPQPCPTVTVPAQDRTTDITELVWRAKEKRCAQRMARMTKVVQAPVSRMASVFNSSHVDLNHLMRMNQLSLRLAQLRDTGTPTLTEGHERTLVEQMIYALSPSLMPPNYVVPQMNQRS